MSQEALIPLTPRDEAAVIRQEILVVIAAAFLEADWPVGIMGKTISTTTPQGNRVRIKVEVDPR